MTNLGSKKNNTLNVFLNELHKHRANGRNQAWRENILHGLRGTWCTKGSELLKYTSQLCHSAAPSAPPKDAYLCQCFHTGAFNIFLHTTEDWWTNDA